jgi:uncharacterized protein (DUF1501 family)
MITRRNFLRSSSLIALTPFVPTFLDETARAAGAAPDSRILVVVQLDGGNDGINTLVPYADEAYPKLRKELRIKSDEVLKINDRVGLHPAMRSMSQLLGQGRLAIAQGVGYPNPNRSHFESMRIWQTASLKPAETQPGWLAQSFDQLPWPRAASGPDAIYVGDSDLPRALVGRRTDAAAIATADDLALRLPTDKSNSADNPKSDATSDDISSFVNRTVLGAYSTARELSRPRPASAPEVVYPQTKLATQLQLVSRFIKSGAATRVYYASQTGYDTHYAQLPQHEDLLRELSNAIKTFLDDLKSAGLSDRVLLMAFSEFGRRAAENGSLGTDHGSAGPVFLAGEKLNPGLMGPTPNLSDLEKGDIKMSTDFRSLYATLLKDWLTIPITPSLTANLKPLPLLKPL